MVFTEENYNNAKSGDVFEFTCKRCGATFYKSKRYLSKNKKVIPLYCSQRCSRLDHEKDVVKVLCKECGKEFEISKYTYNKKIKENSEFFCSRSCSAKYNNRQYPKRKKESTSEICPECGGRKSASSVFCKNCSKERSSYKMLNRELGYYIGYDKRLPYLASRCTEIRKMAKKILLEDESREKVCEICHNHELDSILEVHHIKAIKDFDPHSKISEINDKNNLMWVCPNHHKLIENGTIKIE